MITFVQTTRGIAQYNKVKKKKLPGTNLTKICNTSTLKIANIERNL